MERCENWLTLDNLRFVDRYINQEFHILLKFKMGDSGEYIASFQWDSGDGQERATKIDSNLLSGMASLKEFGQLIPFTWRHAASYVRRASGKQQAVLVDTVKLMDLPDRVIPSFVWFDRVDRVFSRLPHALYFSTEERRCVFVGVLRNGEASLRSDSVAPAFLGNEMAGEMVKGTSEILENVSSLQTDRAMEYRER